MPSYTDTSSGYVQWQSARRQAKQMAQDAAIDIIEHYNRIMSNDDHDHFGRVRRLPNQGAGSDVAEDDSPRVDMLGRNKKLTPRGQSKKTTTLRAESLDKKGGVFTEGISSLSRQSQFPLSLKRSDIITENLPDTIKVAREKSRIYLALSQPSARQPKDPYKSSNKGDLSAKSVKSLVPPSSYPWSDMLSPPEMTRSKTFTADERAGLATRSTLDSRQTASDIHPVKDRKSLGKQGLQFSLFYPTMTGAPPNTPLNMPQPYTPKVPSVSIVSLGGDTVEHSAKKQEIRPRLPVPFKCPIQPDSARGKANSGTQHLEAKTSSKPGIDLPQLPLRYTEAKDASFQFTPRERAGRMNYNRGRRRVGIGQMKHSAKLKAELVTQVDKEDSKTSTNDPYSSRFRHMSSVTSMGDVHIPYAPPVSSSSFHPDSDPEDNEVAVPEPTIMLTVHEEDESGDRASQPISVPLQPEVQVRKDPPQPVLPERVLDRTHSLVSNASLLSVPLQAIELSEARPPTSSKDDGVAEEVTLVVPTLPAAELEEEKKEVENLEVNKEEENPADSPPIASTSVVDTARTVATQTSLPFDPDEEEKRPAVLKIKTLSMFPDINSPLEVPNGGMVGQPPGTAASEPLFRLSHVDNYGDAVRLLGLPELRSGHNAVRDLMEDDPGDLKGKSNTVQNITFISPLEVQQKAKRFWHVWQNQGGCHRHVLRCLMI